MKRILIILAVLLISLPVFSSCRTESGNTDEKNSINEFEKALKEQRIVFSTEELSEEEKKKRI